MRKQTIDSVAEEIYYSVITNENKKEILDSIKGCLIRFQKSNPVDLKINEIMQRLFNAQEQFLIDTYTTQLIKLQNASITKNAVMALRFHAKAKELLSNSDYQTIIDSI